MATRSAIINVMAKAADKAARSLKRDFGEVSQLQVSQKGPGDFVSNADLKSEKTLREELQKARPNFGFLMEESGEVKGSDPDHRWIVDPLDGTTNFLHGLPHFAISIALEQKGEIVAGLVYDPAKDELFWAEKGGGAFCNDRRMRVSGRKQLPESLLSTGIPFIGHGDRPRFLRQLDAAMRETSGVRRLGAAALDLAYVAAGRYECFWEEDLSSWDIAAGILLVKEAGGYVSDMKGGQTMLQTGSVLASNGTLHAPLQALLGGA
ncbi:MAG TPA: inositol monophosphatase family protein [Dongiaceae bacterium]|jgi:myo-inositol-1(or 4)-monophosphatase|nr:inositol monophosphatase family protein [Dongiaceae bacterium]